MDQLPTAPPTNWDEENPKFCLRHLVGGFSVSDLDQAGRAAFATALECRAKMTWREITLAPRHGLGLETLRADALRAPIPAAFRDRDKVIVLRYDGKLPMAGVRIRDVLHVLWIARTFADLYDHG